MERAQERTPRLRVARSLRCKVDVGADLAAPYFCHNPAL